MLFAVLAMLALGLEAEAASQAVTGTVTTNPDGSSSAQLNLGPAGVVVPPPPPATGAGVPGHWLSAASTNATLVKAGASTVYLLALINTTAKVYYFKLYDKASVPNCAVDPVAFTVPVQATDGAVIAVPVGMALATGIAFCLTGGLADNDNTPAAPGVAVSMVYR